MGKTYKDGDLQPPSPSKTSLPPAPSSNSNSFFRPRTMASTFKYFLKTAQQSLSGTSTPNKTACNELFKKVDPEVDGEDCLHDCESCTVKLPRGFKIDEEDQLYGFVKGWSTHVIVATGKSDWVRDVADEKGSVMEAIEKADVKVSNGRLMLSASNIPTPNHTTSYDQPTTILLLPALTIIENVSPKNVNTLIKEYINVVPTNTSPLTPISLPRSLSPPLPSSEQLTSRPSPHSALILLCSQKTRDARCGQSAPLLRKELERHLRTCGLFRDLDDERPGGVGIYFISHVGGHKYSANMMVYRRKDAFGLDGVGRGEVEGEICPVPANVRKGDREKEGEGDEGANQCIWIARVRPEDCEGIVKFTVLQGKVVKPERQLRGGFDRERGVFSW